MGTSLSKIIHQKRAQKVKLYGIEGTQCEIAIQQINCTNQQPHLTTHQIWNRD